MSVRFYNTLFRRVEDFKPLREGEVSLYTCGPTVYNYPHIGNLRTFAFEDLLRRWLLFRGYRVNQVMNLTDVDDKTIRDSRKNGMPLRDFTDIYKKAFFEDLRALNILPAEHYPAATDHIPGMIALIETLLRKGHAYESADGIYFKVSSFPNYGKLANLEHDQLKEGASESRSARHASDEYAKENAADFALWKKWTPEDGDVKWDAPFGAGRPGWHIECSVMSMQFLGETIDIHAGGVDLIFPHHTNEIAQSEAATGKPFVNTWLHATHLVVDGEKMSKSRGNFYTLRDLTARGHPARAVRYALITTHYRKPLNFTFDLIKQAESSLARIDDFVLALSNVRADGPADSALADATAVAEDNFSGALDDDLNIAEAMAAVFDLIRVFYERSTAATRANADAILALIKRMDSVLGFVFTAAETCLTDEERKLIADRTAAKQGKDYARADDLRRALLAKGIEVRDTKDGVVWKRI